MNNNIIIRIEESEALYAKYRETYKARNIFKCFTFDSNKSINDNLNNLSFFALRETLPVLYSYPQIFLDLISRWIENSNLEHQFKSSFQLDFKINGSIILHALSKLVNISNESISLIEYFLSNTSIFQQLDSQVNARELEIILLAYYRFLTYDHFKFKKFIDPKILNQFLQFQDPDYNVVKYLSVLLLSVYLQSSEVVLKDMINKNVDTSKLISNYDDTETIDYKFLNLVEAKRVANFHDLPNDKSLPSKNAIVIEPQHLSNLTISIYGILIPHLMKTTKLSEFSDLVPTENSVEVLKKLALNIQNNRPTLLFGKAGSGKTFLFNQLAKIMSYQDSIVKIHLGEQTDAKLLLGTYSSGEKPGTFKWRSGVLTTAVKEGKWVLIEDIDKAPTEVLSILLTLLEKRQLIIPSRGEVIKAHNNFQLISTIRVGNNETISDLIGLRLWSLIEVKIQSDVELAKILNMKFPLLRNLLRIFIKCYEGILQIYSTNTFISLNKGSHPRVISSRDLIKFCSRCNKLLVNQGIESPDQLLESSIYDNFFQEAIDCFGSAITERDALIPLTNIIGDCLEIPTSRINLFLSKHIPLFINDDTKLKVGRALLQKSATDNALNKSKNTNSSFATTNHSLRLMEQICVSIEMLEPVLLVGETGTGKTTVVQQVAKLMNKKLTVINVSQQTESGDLLGGYKPVNTKVIAIPMQEVFENLFMTTFSRKKNEKFSLILSKVFNRNQWKNVIKLWREAVKMSKELLNAELGDSDSESEGNPKKKRKLKSHERRILLDKWVEFEAKVNDFEVQSSSLDNSFVFNFVEGSLVNAIRNGDWLLLDELNLASSDTLESIADLLADSVDQRSILLSEKGDIEPIKAHPDFRIFGCMNPSTDVGKKDLPLSIRSRFSEIYVHSPDKDYNDLIAIIEKYVGRFAVADDLVIHDIANLYLEAKNLSESNKIVDGANQKPHFSIRTLTRTLVYVVDIISIYGLRRSLYEGFCMSFLTLLDLKSEAILKPIIERFTIDKLKNKKATMGHAPPPPSKNPEEYVKFRHYWMKHGPQEVIPQPHYIITPFVEKNMLNLVRATSGRRFPVLIQGPTSAGKTSMINYLANITGHKFVRINNHEHTDLQEYLGTYVSNSTGKLEFKEGILVEAIRNGYWIVLDELNLAPTDILEALNRLLDDNRELFIPETQEVVHPHPDFMLFATQNPPGLYGGRKVLSRAFRNRFLELHFDDIPQDELEIILKERCQIAPSYGKRIVEVYKQLTIQRQSTRLFEQKNSFATLRDLFRWALREAVGYEELAANGYMLLAERVRKPEEKLVVKQTIEKVMRVKLDMEAYYEKLEEAALMEIQSPIVWTKAMRRLAVLVSASIKYNEPLLLVGETGCGKTTVCQVLAQFLQQNLIIVNAHQNTETSDILGAQRPVRNRFETRSRLFNNLCSAFETLGLDIPLEEAKVEDLSQKFNSLKTYDGLDQELVDTIKQDIVNNKILFEWNDGPLIHAMKQGELFLLDEISLADDSVLERLNSVLEPERSVLLAEKGTDDAFIVAHEKFQFLATMNPGGDYGKKELSPALRNRFTEIWVPSMDDFADVRQIVENKLNPEVSLLTNAIVAFAEHYGKTYGGGNATSGVISLRDILAWVQFINSCKISPNEALLHGAAMVFIDALGTNNTAYLAESEEILTQHKLACVAKLSELVGEDLKGVYQSAVAVQVEESKLKTGSFEIPRIRPDEIDEFLLHAPTTAANAMRVIRAMQVHKPILLEGSPGVGKTSLVSAIAKATGNNLIRINLSEQTDLVDLFGSDTPAEGGKTGEFVWRDAPFLRAMQKGEWVLLDEMNLASQSVLEGLNACLDHRGEAYIPELDKSFTCHPDFTVFAAQNPQYQGGGRKGLPKSFVNRFTVVYVDVLKKEDLNMISQHIYPNIDKEICSQIIEFMTKLEEETVVKKSWGSSGGPWEFNLRDTLRWLSLLSSGSIARDISPADYIDMIVCQRFRTPEDRSKATELFESIFGHSRPRDNYYHCSSTVVQACVSTIERKSLIHYNNETRSVPLQSNYKFIETAIRSVNNNLPLILTGPSNAGKTELIRFLANKVGAKLHEFAMNSDVDSMDILGGYEQVDLTRGISTIVSNLKDTLQRLILTSYNETIDQAVLLHLLESFGFLENSTIDIENFNLVVEHLRSLSAITGDSYIQGLLSDSLVLLEKISEESSVKFEWFDGLLVQAVEKGYWLILDNANLCSPSVLDRLNSLLEVNGSLIINECSSEDGLPRVLQPHPNFRLFLTMDPKYGELSRAMRNRGIEVYMESLDDRSTPFDKRILHPASAVSGFINSVISEDRVYAELHDIFKLNEKSASLASASLGLLQFNMFNEITNWENVVQNSNEFNDIDGFYVSELKQRADVFSQEFKLPQALYGIYPENDQTVFQKLNPAINSAIISVLSREYIGSSEPTYFFQILGDVLTSQIKLNAIEENAMNGNMDSLNYVELSAAAHLGRNIKKLPKLNVYSFLKDINEFFIRVLEVACKDQLFNHPSLFKSLFALHTIRETLLIASQKKNDSQLRVFRDLITAWCEEYQDEDIIKVYVGILVSSVNSISESMNLESGFLMETIWENFRTEYPTSEENWSKFIELSSIISDFDSVAIQQNPDAIEQIAAFKKSLLSVLDSVIDGTIQDSEYESVVAGLKTGIEKLRSVAEGFSIKRTNEFQDEFKLLSMFAQANESGMNEIIRMSSFAGRPTMEFAGYKNSSLFKPYPSVLENSVLQLFDNTLSSNSIHKAVGFNETSGKLLQMKLADMKVFSKELINNSENVLVDSKDTFGKLLQKWILELAKACCPDLVDINSAVDLLPERAASVFQNFLVPAAAIASDFGSKEQLGVAWVLFACGAIQLYLPSSAYDPAIKEHVIYEKVLLQQRASEDLIKSWKQINDVISGQQKSLSLEAIEEDIKIEEALKPRVFRSGSFDPLFEEWKAFMDSSVNPQHIERLLEAAKDISDESTQLINMFQNNSSQFVLRLDNNFKLFSDLNDIVKGYILALRIGLDLITDSTAQKGKYNAIPLAFTEVSTIGNYSEVKALFEAVLNFSKKLKVDSQLTENIMAYFMKVSFAHGIEVSQPTIDSALQAIYYRWTLRKIKESEQNMQSESLYKYNDPDEDIEGDFKTLFPDYEEVLDTDIKDFKTTQSFDSSYYKIAKTYVDAFNTEKDYTFSELINEGNNLFALMFNSRHQFIGGDNQAVNIVSAIFNFAQTYNKFTTEEVSFDFYRESSHIETRRAIGIVNNIISFVENLLNEWPDHSTLLEICRVSKEFLDYPLSTPIARQLQKIEQIYTFIAEWEKYAHSKVSLKVQFDQLTNLIVSWRRLELSTWKKLFDYEDKELEVSTSKWWFHLFETLIIPLYSGEELRTTNVLLALNVFISQASFGEFRFRLALVRAFKEHIFRIEGEGDVYTAVSNFLTFYEQFNGAIEEKIVAQKKKLEKDINEVILLTSWKDVNIDALKQSARRSHNSLYKIVRKYRSLLATPVSGVIEQGIADESTNLQLVSLPLVTGDTIDTNSVREICSQVSTWAERPQRLQDLTTVDKNMDIYIKRISSEELPTMYEYAKEILSELESLRKETPSVYKEDTKKLIASLKNEKAKLLSNTLKELRRTGLKLVSKPEVKKAVSSSNLLLSISASFEKSVLKGADAYYFRVLELLPRLRSSVLQLPDDVPQPDVEKGFGATENMIYSLVVSRQPMLNLSESVLTLEEVIASFRRVSQLYDTDETISPTTVVSSCTENIKRIKNILLWLPKVLDFAIEGINSCGLFGETVSSDIFYTLKSKLNEFHSQLKSLGDIPTSKTSSFITVVHDFIELLRSELQNWATKNHKVGFIAYMVIDWLQKCDSNIVINSSTTIQELHDVTDIEKSLRAISSNIIVVIQKFVELQKNEITEEDDDWYSLTQHRMSEYIKTTHHRTILRKLRELVGQIKAIEYNSDTSKIVSALVAFSMPLFQHYLQLTVSVLSNLRESYIKNSHAVFIFSSILYSLATKGFCTPEAPSEEKQDDNLQDGTGLGDGEGADNNSNDVEDDEDLSEQAQTENKEKDENQDDNNDDAVDIEGDMAGDLEEAEGEDDEENEEENEDMDEEIDDIDDLDPNAIDEKMWDEETKENDKEKDSDKLPDSTSQQEMVANEDEQENGDQEDQKKEDQEDQESNDKPEEAEDGEEENVGEQEDDVKNQENEEMDDHVPETEALELPEDMNLDGDDEDDKEDDGDNADDMALDDDPANEDEDADENAKEDDSNDIDQDKDAEENEEDVEEGVEEDVNMEGEEEGEEEEGEEKGESNEKGDEAMESEDEAVKDEEQKNEENGDGEAEEDEIAEGVEGGDNDDAQEDVDIESAVKQEAGERGEGADNQVFEEQEDLGAAGGAQTNAPQEDNQTEEPQNDDSQEKANESIKELGDALKEFHRRHQEIKESSKTEEDVQEKANERPDEFEHVDGENTNTDTQALGGADKDQIQSIDDDKAIDDDIEEEPQVKQEQETAGDDMEVDENLEDVNENDPDADFKGKSQAGFVNDRNKVKEEAGLMQSSLDVEEMLDQFDLDDDDVKVTEQDLAPISLETARDLWRHSELSTQELASGLCEQLRLILEPTLATKLRGDYKTGKRLNMKRIIPYIASEFRKDKIWLRRTKPSKRQYQIMIAVDDSKSMSESKSTELAFHSIALVSKALTQLESGGLSIVRFGEDVKVVHPFDKPFNNQESGAKIFQYFDFQQTRTDIKNLCKKSLQIFENAKATSSGDLWQLQIIISDGVCEDHETIQALVRKARESRIMLVFVVIDGINSNESILDMSQVKYELDSTGNSVLKVDKYLDSFPFEFYVVVRNINELPEMLSLVLRQYFSEAASN